MPVTIAYSHHSSEILGSPCSISTRCGPCKALRWTGDPDIHMTPTYTVPMALGHWYFWLWLIEYKLLRISKWDPPNFGGSHTVAGTYLVLRHLSGGECCCSKQRKPSFQDLSWTKPKSQTGGKGQNLHTPRPHCSSTSLALKLYCLCTTNCSIVFLKSPFLLTKKKKKNGKLVT